MKKRLEHTRGVSLKGKQYKIYIIRMYKLVLDTFVDNPKKDKAYPFICLMNLDRIDYAYLTRENKETGHIKGPQT
jgi:hypothetical protein